jgi:hypothetical protein
MDIAIDAKEGTVPFNPAEWLLVFQRRRGTVPLFASKLAVKPVSPWRTS